MSIVIDNVSKHFVGFRALNNVSLEIPTGGLVALLGPSGCGKTTLLRIVAGLDRQDSGRILFDGDDMTRIHARDRRVGFVFQHYALFRHMTVFDNIAFGLSVKPRRLRPTAAEINAKVCELLALVQLEGLARRYPSQLSGGQRQRVALARALAVNPKVLLLDEPFGALDARVRKELRRWLRQLHDDLHVTSIFVTHDQEEAMEVSDRVVVMNHGRIEQVGTPEQVYHYPANGFVYDFLGNYNEFAGWRDEHNEIHLAEDDLWEGDAKSASAMPEMAMPLLKRGWLRRYPEVVNVLRKIVPVGANHSGTEIIAAKPSRREMRAMLAERGTPVRVFARPHEMFVAKTPEDGQEYIPVRVMHINPAGPLAKLDLQRRNGVILQAEVPKQILDTLNIRKFDSIFVRPKQTRVFE